MKKMQMFAALLLLCLPLSLFAHHGPDNQKQKEQPKPFLAQEAMEESWFQAQPANCHPAACNIQLAPGTEMSEAFIPVSRPARSNSAATPEKGRKTPVFEDHTTDL